MVCEANFFYSFSYGDFVALQNDCTFIYVEDVRGEMIKILFNFTQNFVILHCIMLVQPTIGTFKSFL